MGRRTSRTVLALAALPAAGVLVLATSAAAHAAEGGLWLSGQPHPDPHGCYSFDPKRRPSVINATDEPVTVYNQPDCEGPAVATVQPGGATFLPQSVRSASIE